MFVDEFPAVSETFVTAEARAMRDLGVSVRVEAHNRAWKADPAGAVGLDARYLEDDGVAERLAALAWLLRRVPLRLAADLVSRRRWKREEQMPSLRALAPIVRRIVTSGDEHLHAHFGAGAALTALRVHRLTGLPYSVTVHGYDIFLSPRNLAEKLACAAFVTSGSDYTVGYLRRKHPQIAERIHKIVMGIDPELWARTTPSSDSGVVLAVGRLVAKKGFSDLLRSAALLRDEPAFKHVLIVGDGPLRDDLRSLHAELGLDGAVRFLGARPSHEVRTLLEDAEVVAIPCVIAPDGDRDSMPVIAKEALAMEVPVVASDAAGLPEVVREPWGRTVPAGDHVALADALREVLTLDPAALAENAAAGRRFVAENFTVEGETRKLIALIDAAVAQA